MGNENFVYRSGWPFKLTIKPTSKRLTRDQHGNETVFVENVKQVPFTNCFLVVNDALSKSLGLPKETIAEWVQGQPSFGKRYWLVSSPDKPADKEVAAEIVESQKTPSKTKVIHGARTTGRATK